MTLPERVPKLWTYQDEFPGWRVWKAENRRCHARLPGTEPLVIVHGEDPVNLRDEIIRVRSDLEPSAERGQV